MGGLRDASAGLFAGGCGCKGFAIAAAFAFTAAGSSAGSFWCKGSVPAAAFAAAGSADTCLLVNEFVLLARDRRACASVFISVETMTVFHAVQWINDQIRHNFVLE